MLAPTHAAVDAPLCSASSPIVVGESDVSMSDVEYTYGLIHASANPMMVYPNQTALQRGASTAAWVGASIREWEGGSRLQHSYPRAQSA
jgi:hypothetical protein